MSLAQLQQDIYDKLKFISSTFFQENMKTSPTTGNVGTASFIGDNFQEKLFSGYGSFKTRYLAGAAASNNGINTTKITTSTPSLYSRDPDSNVYTVMTLPAASNAAGSNIAITSKFTDVNLSYFLQSNTDLVTELDNNRKLYSLISSQNYQNYKDAMTNSASVKISKYYISTASDPTVTYSGSNIRDLQKMINALTKANLFTTSDITTSCTNCMNMSITDPPSVALPSGLYDSIRRLTAADTSNPISTTMPLEFERPSSKNSVTISFYVQIDSSAAASVCTLETIVQAGSFVQTSQPEQVDKRWKKIVFTSSEIDPITIPSDIKPNFKIRVNHKGFNIPINITGVSVSYSSSAADIKQMFNLGQTDLFTLRRLLLLYECIAHIYIAMYLMENGAAAYKLDYYKIAGICFENLVHLNRNVTASTGAGNGTISAISGQVAERMKEYKKNVKDVTILDNQVKELKTSLKSEVEKINTNKTIASRTQNYMHIAVAILVLVAIACVAAYFVPMKPSIRIGVLVGIVALAIAAGAAIPAFYNREGFAGENIYTLGQYQKIADATSTTAIVATYELATLDEANKFLMNTIYLANMLQSNINYGNANVSVNKELEYYRGATQQLDNSTNTLRGTTGVIRLDNTVSHANMTFFLTMTIVIAMTVLAVVLTSKWPETHKYIYITASIVVVISIMLYIMDTSARVRTDGQKKYWGKPKYTGN
jgi:hypothetical protein